MERHLPLGLPPPQGVDADPDRLGHLADAQVLRHERSLGRREVDATDQPHLDPVAGSDAALHLA